MDENRRRLIDTAVKPLADNVELQLAAVALLDESTAKFRGNADEAIARWDAVDAKKSRPWVKWGCIAVGLILSAWAWTVAAREGHTYWQLQKVSAAYRYMSDDYSADSQTLENCISRPLSAPDRLLLFGNTSRNTLTEAMKGLWDSEPESPAFFMEFAIAHSIDHRCLPKEFLETARRLAPENSWPVYLSAADGVRKIVKPMPQASIGPREWDVLDPKTMDERLSLVCQATALPQFETYQTELLGKRISLLPMNDQLEYMTAHKILWQESPREGFAGLLNLLAAKAWQCAKTADREGFQGLVEDLEGIERRWLDSETDNMMTESRLGSGFRSAMFDFHLAAETLGLSPETEKFKAILERFEKRGKDRRAHGPEESYNQLESHYPVLLTEMRRGCQEFPHPPWTMDDLKPGRLSDHEWISRACCLLAWIVLGVAALSVALFRFRLPVLLRRLSVRVGELMAPVDYLCIIAVGVVLPYVFTMAVNRLTPLGGREWGVFGTYGLLPAAQFLGMVLLMLIVPVLVIRWCMAKRAGFFISGGSRFGLCGRVAICAALLIPLVGWAGTHTSKLIYVWPMLAALTAFPIFWILGSSLRVLSGSAKMRLLGSAVIARALVPVYTVAMLLMAAAAPFHKAAERAWFRKDAILRMDPAQPAMSPYEFAVARQFRAELREILGVAP